MIRNYCTTVLVNLVAGRLWCTALQLSFGILQWSLTNCTSAVIISVPLNVAVKHHIKYCLHFGPLLLYPVIYLPPRLTEICQVGVIGNKSHSSLSWLVVVKFHSDQTIWFNFQHWGVFIEFTVKLHNRERSQRKRKSSGHQACASLLVEWIHVS